MDATQGVEAQTVANAYLAMEHKLEMIPIINKIDLPAAEPERIKEQIEDIIGIYSSEAILASAKAGICTKVILASIVKKIPPPGGDVNKPRKSLPFDSWFDNYQGVIVLVRVFDGIVKKGTRVMLMSTGKEFEVSEVGIFVPKMKTTESLSAGEVGYIIANIKLVTDTKIGDTITDANNPATEACPGYKEIKPMVFSGLYPTETHQYEGLKTALEKLRLNDSSFSYETETSTALGFGFRCGFLGLLHMEIIKERLEREFGLSS